MAMITIVLSSQNHALHRPTLFMIINQERRHIAPRYRVMYNYRYQHNNM